MRNDPGPHKPRRPFAALALLLLFTSAAAVQGQVRPATAAPAAAATTPPPADALGRDTPRGAVFGFLAAARKGENELASQYLNARPGQSSAQSDAQELAHELFTILDARLPTAGLLQLNDTPEGSRANPLAPNEELVATLKGPGGPVAIVLERVARPKTASVWLFSRKTLDDVPDLYRDVAANRTAQFLPRFLTTIRFAGVRIFDWLAMLFGIAAIYVATKILNRLLTRTVGWLWTRLGRPSRPPAEILPLPARLLVAAVAARWVLFQLELSLRVRQVVSNIAVPVVLGVFVWLGLVLTRDLERYVLRRFATGDAAAWLSLSRLGRRLLDAVLILIGLIAALRHFGVDPTPIVAGLGVGGIAIALAAQKTLENVIAGASLIIDHAVQVGDFLKVGEIQGTVDYIGLRSTRIRTLDRTVVTVPNGQIANMTLETISARDKFWFHPVVQLTYDTHAEQMQTVVDGIRTMLTREACVESATVRVRFLKMGTFSLDVEIFAYVFARDWAHFLEIQEQLLLRIMQVVGAAGAHIAFPSQTMYVAAGGNPAFPQLPAPK